MEDPLFYAFCAHQFLLQRDTHVLAEVGGIYPKFADDQQGAYAILDQAAIHLRLEMNPGLRQPFENN